MNIKSLLFVLVLGAIWGSLCAYFIPYFPAMVITSFVGGGLIGYIGSKIFNINKEG